MGLPTLQLGDQHELVPQLRARLANLGFMVGAAPTAEPTVFDSAVQSAVTAFQGKAQLVANGVVDASTWAALGVQDAGGGWGKILLYAALAGGLYWWWRKRKAAAAPYGEFSRRVSRGGYGDDVDERLVGQQLEKPLLLAERGDCTGAAKLLTKWRRYGIRKDAPESTRKLFNTVSRKVTASCPKEVAVAIEESSEFKERGHTPWWVQQIGERSPYTPEPGGKEEEYRARMAKLYSAGQRLPVKMIRRGGKELFPTIRKGKVEYDPRGRGAPSRVRAPLTETQKEKNRIYIEERRKAAREIKRIENELRRKAEGIRQESGQIVTLRGGWED